MHRFDVTLAGDTALDVMLYGLPADLPPERELLVEDMQFALGGSAAITAHNMAVIGARVGFVTPKADDTFARLCLDWLRLAGVDLSACTNSKIHAGMTVMVQHADFRRAFTFPGNATYLRFEDLDLEYLTSSRHFHMSSLFLQKKLLRDVPRLFTRLKEAGMTISLDTNDDPSNEWPDIMREILPLVDIFMPNEREVRKVTNLDDTDQGVKLLRKKVPILVVKRGSRGATVYQSDFEATVTPVDVKVVDAVGAGDSFNAGFLAAYLRNESLVDCLYYGNLIAGLSTTEAGGTTAFRDLAKVESFLASHNGQASRR